ncbi:hypothetical protein ACLB2K_004991 [Fragaria x ananassa]
MVSRSSLVFLCSFSSSSVPALHSTATTSTPYRRQVSAPSFMDHLENHASTIRESCSYSCEKSGGPTTAVPLQSVVTVVSAGG